MANPISPAVAVPQSRENTAITEQKRINKLPISSSRTDNQRLAISEKYLILKKKFIKV